MAEENKTSAATPITFVATADESGIPQDVIEEAKELFAKIMVATRGDFCLVLQKLPDGTIQKVFGALDQSGNNQRVVALGTLLLAGEAAKLQPIADKSILVLPTDVCGCQSCTAIRQMEGVPEPAFLKKLKEEEDLAKGKPSEVS